MPLFYVYIRYANASNHTPFYTHVNFVRVIKSLPTDWLQTYSRQRIYVGWMRSMLICVNSQSPF